MTTMIEHPLHARSRASVKSPQPDDIAVTLTYRDLADLGTQMKRNVQDRDSLLDAITHLNSMYVGDVKVVLEPRLLERLRSRCLDRKNWQQWLAEITRKQLHDYCGW